MKISTGCKELDWIADKVVFTTDEEFEGETWKQFVFQGTLNRRMVRAIRVWIDTCTTINRPHQYYDHFLIMIDGVKYEFNCRMPSDSRANYETSWIMISQYTTPEDEQ